MEEDYRGKQATIKGRNLKRLEDILLRWRSIIMINDLTQFKKDVIWIEKFLNRRGFDIRETLREAIWRGFKDKRARERRR